MRELPHLTPRSRHLLRRALSVLAAAWATAVLAVWAGQDWLLFAPVGPPLGNPMAPQVVVEPVQLAVDSGVVLNGWLAKPEQAGEGQRFPLVLYFGGNAEEVSANVSWAAKLDGWAILAVNYRGYGGNPGKPSEAALLADALATYDWAKRRTDVDSTRIAVVGRSLGSGVAVHVAAHRPVHSAILLTPYDSIAAVARERFPYLPVDLLLRHRFDSLAKSAQVAAPTLIVIAELDRVISPARGHFLAGAWQGPHEVVLSPATGHADILSDTQVWAAMHRWLKDRGRP